MTDELDPNGYPKEWGCYPKPAPVLGCDAGKAVVQAMGLPLTGCLSADIEMPLDGLACVVVRYYLTAEVLKAAGDALAVRND